MPFMPKNISWQKLAQRLRKFGFSGPYSGGRHLFMIKGEFKLHIPNPHKKDISVALLIRILHQAGISFKEWDNR